MKREREREICDFCSERSPLPYGAKVRLCYFIVALPGSCIKLFITVCVHFL